VQRPRRKVVAIHLAFAHRVEEELEIQQRATERGRAGAPMTAYENARGTGNMHLWFDVA
jgi:hypothetical protein